MTVVAQLAGAHTEPPIAAGYQDAHGISSGGAAMSYPAVVASGTSTAFITEPLAISASARFTSSK